MLHWRSQTQRTVYSVLFMACAADCHIIVDFLQKALRDEVQRPEHELAGDIR